MPYTKEQAKEEINKLIEKYSKVKRDGKEGDFSEPDVGSKFILPFFEALNWDTKNIDEVKEQRRTLIGPVDYSLNIERQPKIFFEIKKFTDSLDGYREVKGKRKSYAEQAIDYAWQARVDWAVLTNFKETRLYYSHVKKPEEGLVFKLKLDEYLSDKGFEKLWLLSKSSVEGGVLDTYEKRRTREDVSTEVVNDLYTARKALVGTLNKNNELTKEELRESVQRILDRLVVVRVAEDRGVIHAESLSKMVETWKETTIDMSVRTLMRDLKNLFRDFDSAYNSKLFEKHPCEDLKIDNEVLEEVINTLYKYNFDLIDADVLGSIYEDYIGHILEEKEKELDIVEDYRTRKEAGIYYTPTYVVDYIVRNTLGKLLKGKTPEEVSKIKVLDPACGSGSFLIKAFDIIKEHYDEYNKRIHENAKKGNSLEGFKDIISNVEKRILTENLYGVDLDEQAAEIASVNLMLKALKPKEKLPLILDENIKVGNSLISGTEDELKQYFGDGWEEKRPFNWEDEFPDIFVEGGFDVIIGNPPYIRVDNLKKEDKIYWKDSNRFDSNEGKYDIYYLFIESAYKWLKDGGMCGFIVPNKFCAASSAKKLRDIIFNFSSSCYIVSISNLDVFRDAANYPLLLIVTKGRNIEKIKISSAFSQEEFLNKNFVSYELDKENLNYLPSKIIPININQKQLDLVIKLLKRGEKLSQYLKISEGLRIPQKFETSNTDKFELVKQYQFDRYSPIKEGSYISESNLRKVISPKSERYVNSLKEKIVIAEDALRITSTIDDKHRIPQGGVYFGVLINDKVHIKYIISLLNSKLLSFVYNTLFGGMHMGGGYLRYRTEFLAQLPIKFVSKQEQRPFIELVDKMLSLSKQYNETLWIFQKILDNIKDPSTELRPFREYYEEGSDYGISLARTKKLMSGDLEGEVTAIEVIESDDFLLLKARYNDEKDFKPVIQICIEDSILRKFFYYATKTYLIERSRKKVWGRGKIVDIVLNAVEIPRFVPNKDKDKERINKLMSEFFANSPIEDRSLTQIEEEIWKTDNTIDQKVYELYGLGEEEIKIIEKAFA